MWELYSYRQMCEATSHWRQRRRQKPGCNVVAATAAWQERGIGSGGQLGGGGGSLARACVSAATVAVAVAVAAALWLWQQLGKNVALAAAAVQPQHSQWQCIGKRRGSADKLWQLNSNHQRKKCLFSVQHSTCKRLLKYGPFLSSKYLWSFIISWLHKSYCTVHYYLNTVQYSTYYINSVQYISVVHYFSIKSLLW